MLFCSKKLLTRSKSFVNLFNSTVFYLLNLVLLLSFSSVSSFKSALRAACDKRQRAK